MINEVARALTDWFNDPSTGIVAKLAALPRDSGTSPPVVGTIADARNNLVAQKRFPSVPGIAVNVRQVSALDGENNTVTGEAVIDVLVRVARENPDTGQSADDVSDILRAVLQSWRAFNAKQRTRNGVQFYDCQKLMIAPDWTPVEDAISTGAANAQMHVRDLLALS